VQRQQCKPAIKYTGNMISLVVDGLNELNLEKTGVKKTLYVPPEWNGIALLNSGYIG
jgi:hypothetical protein